jgi:hypothetical protein
MRHDESRKKIVEKIVKLGSFGGMMEVKAHFLGHITSNLVV